MSRPFGILVVVLLVLGVAGPVDVARAQQPEGDEVALLEAAARSEAEGDLDGAERSLRRVLDHRRASAPALLGLERILRIQGRLAELVPLVDRGVDGDPSSALLNELRLRTLSALDRTDALERAAAAWIAAVPRIEVPYRGVASMWAERGELRRAITTVERARDALGRPDALALELGDLYLTLDEPALAAEEWGRSIGESGRGLSQVRRRLRSLPDGGQAVIPDLVATLSTGSAPPGRVEAALDLAIEAGLEGRVRELTARVLPELTLEGRRTLFEEIGRRSDAEGRSALALWAFGRWLEVDERGDERSSSVAGRHLVIQNRVAELALEVGDTAAATAGLARIESAADPDSPQRRTAAAVRVELLVLQDPVAAAEALHELLEDHPAAPEADELAAAVADALFQAGEDEEAARALASVDGPHSAAVRGRLALADGDVDAARVAYMKAAAGLRGSQATEVLGLVTLLGRISPPAAVAIGEAATLRSRGEPGAAVDRLLLAIPRLGEAERAPILAFAATLADEAGLPGDARTVRDRIVRDHPRAPEAPGALLDLARSLAADPSGPGVAVELLERLIIEYPRSALVPQARRELERIRQEDRG